MPQLSNSRGNTLEIQTTFYQQTLDRALPYLKERGIEQEVAERYRLGVVVKPCSGDSWHVGRLVIPYLTKSGPVLLRSRCMQDHKCKEVNCPKYAPMGKDREQRLFNVNALFSHGDTVAVTEGEIDAITLSELVGVPAVGVPGASAWKDPYSRLFSDFRRVLLVVDGDEAGRGLQARLMDELDNAVPVTLPDGEDVNSLYLAEGAENLRKRLG